MEVWIEVREHDFFSLQKQKKTRLRKKIEWIVPPSRGEIVFVGANEHGENAGINSTVRQVAFSTDGSIDVELELCNLREEYEEILELLLRDGFKEI